MKRVAGYGRVSTLMQVKEGTSAEDQKERVQKECKAKDFKLYKFSAISG
jgi:DNA invertase Pin-like site-specific DNA recombinase